MNKIHIIWKTGELQKSHKKKINDEIFKMLKEQLI